MDNSNISTNNNEMLISQEMLLRTIEMMKTNNTNTITVKELVSYFGIIGIIITTIITTIITYNPHDNHSK